MPRDGVHRHYSKSTLGSPSEFARVAMVQPTDPWNRNDLPRLSRLYRPLFRSVFFQPEMRSVRMVVVDIRPNHSSKLALMDRDHRVQAIAS